jgi:hypothetical protein
MLDRLSDCEHEQIYKIIRDYTDNVTFSETGVLVSADILSENCFDRIEQYINFCVAQRQRLDADDAKRRALYKMIHSE